MSTKSSIVYSRKEDCCLHIYHETNDDMIHMEFTRKEIDIDFIIPDEMWKELRKQLREE